MLLRQVLAWGVHLYTALGLVAAGGIAVAIIDGRPASFRLAFFLMVVATVIDATDGMLARWVRVKEVLPNFDGRRLDDIVDFQTYTTLPLLLLVRARALPEGQEFWLIAPLLASAYGFCQTAAKTDDGYFLGFPSYWNVISFYIYVLQPPTEVTVVLLLTFAVLTFVPLRYLYPTMRGRLNRLTNQMGLLWGVFLVWILGRLPEHLVDGKHADAATRLMTLVSLIYPVYYLGMSWAINVRLWRNRARRPQSPHAKPERE
jgi:phosphatidylcholine synthase